MQGCSVCEEAVFQPCVWWRLVPTLTHATGAICVVILQQSSAQLNFRHGGWALTVHLATCPRPPIWQKGNTGRRIPKGGMCAILGVVSCSPYDSDSTHICTTLHLAFWLQMQLPGFFLIGPSGQLPAGAWLRGNKVLFLVGLFFSPTCSLPKVEHAFKRMARINGKWAFGPESLHFRVV